MCHGHVFHGTAVYHVITGKKKIDSDITYIIYEYRHMIHEMEMLHTVELKTRGIAIHSMPSKQRKKRDAKRIRERE